MPGACGMVAPAFLWVWVRGRCSTCLETSVPSPIWPRSHWESREQTRDHYKKPQLLRKPVSGKKPFDLPRCVLPPQTCSCSSRTEQAPRMDHRGDTPAGEEGAFPGSRKAQGAMEGHRRGHSRVQHSGALKRSSLQHPFNRTKQATQLGLSPGSRGDFKQHFQETPALFPSGLRQGQGHSCPRIQSEPQGRSTVPTSHEPPGGQDPTRIPPASHPHPGWKRSRAQICVRSCTHGAVCALGCLCPTPSPANLIVPPHLPFSSLQGV